MNTKYTNPKFAPRKGYPNDQIATVSEILNNDYYLYFRSVELLELHGPHKAAEMLSNELSGSTTPCGEKFGKTALKFVLSEMKDEVQ